jgi:nucleoside-diphosphate-sugar epimerase
MATVNSQAPAVTGASGYVGSWIVRRLLEEGHNVRGTVRDPGKKSGLEHLHGLAGDRQFAPLSALLMSSVTASG